MRRAPFVPMLAMLLACGASTSAGGPAATVAPELPRLGREYWINSPPLTLAGLRGRPALIEFWTFACHNCRNTLPWVERMHARYGPRGLAVIAVHTPEFYHERNADAVAQAVARLGIRYPVLIDNDYAYWRALDNRYWPAFYLVDPQGRVVDMRIGELHAGERRADAFEAAIAALLQG
jgi:thiol-disulfide isomerase/thioredoxin